VYLLNTSLLIEKLVQGEHNHTLHGGISLTMARVREEYWVSRLRTLVRKVIKSCWEANTFKLEQLSFFLLVCTQGNYRGLCALRSRWRDFAGPIRCRKSPRVEGKAFLVFYACTYRERCIWRSFLTLTQ
jgi:hypothetical protein